MAHLALYLFGPFQATLEGNEVTNFATDKARALLAYLAVEADRPHRRDALAGLLWPDLPQDRARQSLRQTLSRVRQALRDRDPSAPFFLVQQERVQFSATSDSWLDVAAFTTILAACQTHAHRHIGACRPCLDRLQQAAALYRGDLLDQFFLPDSAPFEEWALFKRDWLRQQAMEALAVLATYHERRADYPQAQLYAWRQVELEPWCEEAHRQLMRLLAQTGKRSAALAQYESCCRTLAESLGVEPTAETVVLYEQIRDGVPVHIPPRHNLPPPPGPLVGREKELSDLAELLSGPHGRMVTLVGPGGIGKTRLALQVAAGQRGTVAHGVYFVPLSATRTIEAVILAIGDALGVEFYGREAPREQLLAHLREKELFLVLDSMEHLLETTDLLADILQQAPGVVLLVTSRERLNLREEWVYTLRGLACPSSRNETSAEHGAMVLFAQSAHRVAHDFDPEAEARCIAEICQMVEGLPLAIELAAAWVSTWRCEEIAAAIARNLDILVSTLTNIPDRHRSIRATFAHSWELLTPAEQDLFSKLAVFRGGFQSEAVQHVARAGPERLATLVSKSMLRRESTGRYQLHELLRQYAAEHLAASGSEGPTEEHHGVYYCGFVRDREQGLQGLEQKTALAEIAAEIENVRTAWQWATTGAREAEIGAALGGLDLFYEHQSWYHEGHEAFAQAAAGLQTHGQAGRVLHQVLVRQARFAQRLGQNEPARDLLTRCLEFFHTTDDHREEALALNLLAEVYIDRGSYAQAEGFLKQALELCQKEGNTYLHAWAVINLGDVTALQGNFDAARSYCAQGLALGQASGTPLRIASALSSLGRTAAIQGDYGEADNLFGESLRIYREFGHRRGIAGCLNNLGSLAYVAGDYAQARRLRLETLALCQEIGFRWGVANTLKSLGDIARQMGRPAEARRYLERALRTQQDMGDLRAQANTLNSLGAVAQNQGELEQAGQHLRRALALAVESGALPVAIDVLNGVAAILAAQGRPLEALELNAFVLVHPAGEKQTRDRAEALRGELLAQLAPSRAAEAEARGQSTCLEDVVANLPGL
jgi:predicted ATPase/DNA-binding SARP family transcriptional activator